MKVSCAKQFCHWIKNRREDQVIAKEVKKGYFSNPIDGTEDNFNELEEGIDKDEDIETDKKVGDYNHNMGDNEVK